MYQHQLHQKIAQCAKRKDFPEGDAGILFLTRFIANAAAIKALYDELYASHPNGRECFDRLLAAITRAFIERSDAMKDRWKCLPQGKCSARCGMRNNDPMSGTIPWGPCRPRLQLD